MAYLYLSEYLSDSNRRTAQVWRKANNTGFQVRKFEYHNEIGHSDFATESQADNYAEDWVLQDPVVDLG